MLKAVSRGLGFLLLAAGFVAAVMDGARSLASSGLDYARLAATAYRLFGERMLALQPAVERNLHPLLWDPVLVTLGLFPTSLVLLGLGLVLHRLGRRAPTPIGHLTRN